MNKLGSGKIFLNLSECGIKEDGYQTVAEACQVALGQEGIEDMVDISFSLVSPEEIQEFNRTYRQVDAVTDILSFSINESSGGHLELGDVVINLGRTASQAQEHDHSFRRELQYLIVHSVLHCLGYDHIGPEDRKVTRTREKEVMACSDGDEVGHEGG